METFPDAEAGFELVPPEDEEFTPEEDLDAAEAAALEDPFVVDEVGDAAVPYGRSWAFDFQARRMIRRGGSPAEVRGEAALHVWMLTCIHTQVGAHPILPDDFGVERPRYPVGEVDAREAVTDWEVKLREALTVHDRISDVTDFEATYDPAEGVLYIQDFAVVTDEGDRLRFGPLTLATVPGTVDG